MTGIMTVKNTDFEKCVSDGPFHGNRDVGTLDIGILILFFAF